MNNNSAYKHLGWRIFPLGLVTGVLVWLPFEDHSILMPVLLAFPVAALVGRLVNQRFHWSLILCGLVAGLVVAPTTLLWMAFKTGVHGHSTPDYSASQIMLVINITPAWVLGGSILGWVWSRLQSGSNQSAR